MAQRRAQPSTCPQPISSHLDSVPQGDDLPCNGTYQTAQPFSPELPTQTSTHQVAEQNPGHEGPALGWCLQCSHGPWASPSHMVWPCHQNARQLTTQEAAVSMENWVRASAKLDAEETFQGLPQVSLKGLNVHLSTLELLALNCSAWPRRPTKGAVASEKRCTAEAERKQAACKGQTTFTSTAAPTHMCLRSGSTFLAWAVSPATSGHALTDLPSDTEVEVIFDPDEQAS